MILFVLEGKKCEPRLFETLKHLFFTTEASSFVCTYNSNIYSLYSKLKEYDVFEDVAASGNTVTILNDILREKGDDTLVGILEADVSEIFLFFDYDFQESRLTLEENNKHVREMLEYFNDETGAGKLYINYPMVESVFYTKQLPDESYLNYDVTREECRNFKTMAREFSFYKSFDHLLVSNNKNEKAEKKLLKQRIATENWLHLVGMNVRKANYICVNQDAVPASKEDINQGDIYRHQLANYVDTENCRVTVLNSFPIFLYDYFVNLIEHV